jgi:hypothetical protein
MTDADVQHRRVIEHLAGQQNRVLAAAALAADSGLYPAVLIGWICAVAVDRVSR